MIDRVTMSSRKDHMGSRASRLLLTLLLTAGLFAQVGLVRVPRVALATDCGCPAPLPDDADQLDDTSNDHRDDAGGEQTPDDSDLVAPSSPLRRSVARALKLIAYPTPIAARPFQPRPDPGAGHFLAAGRELRYWIRSQLC
jgi:hypothetical protein